MGGRTLILLDTHVLIWVDQNVASLGAEARRLIGDFEAKGDIAVSAISFWEIAMLNAKGRLDIAVPLADWRRDLIKTGIVEMPVTGAIGIAAALLDDLHGDPADRIILSTAAQIDASLLTADRALLQWPGDIARIDATT